MRANFCSNGKFAFRSVLIFIPYAEVCDILHAPPIIRWLIFRSAIFQNEKNETLSSWNKPTIQYYSLYLIMIYPATHDYSNGDILGFFRVTVTGSTHKSANIVTTLTAVISNLQNYEKNNQKTSP